MFVLVLILSPVPVSAATASGSFLVSVTILKSCTFSTSNLAFGVYKSVALNATGTVSVTCTSTTAYQIGANYGLHSPSDHVYRMSGPGSDLLTYYIYKDAAHGVWWGGVQNYDTQTGTGTGTVQVYTAYGGIASGQYVVPGTYGDTITFTLYY